MCRSITWTDESEEHLVKRHNVRPNEVEQVLFTRPRFKKRGRDDTTLIYGQTDAGRYLFVVTSTAGDGGTYIVTAREMTSSEKSEFQRKGR